MPAFADSCPLWFTVPDMLPCMPPFTMPASPPPPPAQPLAPPLLASASAARDSRTALDVPFDFATDDSPHPDPFAGLLIAGRYRMIECIGRGGMGLIYKVEHVELGKLLAIKLLTGELTRDRRVVRRFKREALLVSRLSHPNTVQVFDYGTSDNFTYLVMELVNGKDLAFVVKMQGPLPVARLVPIVIQVCSSLGEAHAMGIVHRDIKLGNIMVSPCCREGSDLVKVLDFGLAKLRDAPELADVTGTGGVVGTPHYMAPEQIRGRAVDGRTDIYSLGAVMYRALTGESVFSGTSSSALFDQHLHDKPIPPHERTPERGIPLDMSAIVMKALEKHPEDRFQRVEELQAALIDLNVLAAPSLNVLLDITRLGALQRDSMKHLEVREAATLELALQRRAATRDEVAAYERKLKRQRWTSTVFACGVAALAAWAAVGLYNYATLTPSFLGMELEPNNTPQQANALPFGAALRGRIGKRLEPQQGDRDFFRIRVPDGTSVVSLRLTALPNMPLCALVYETNGDELEAKFCTGRAGLDLDAPAFRLQPGTYFIAVLQDREHEAHCGTTSVVENVSDDYVLSVHNAAAPSAPLRETEPNDALPGADEVSSGQEVVGMIGWVDDVDFVCAAPAASGASRRVRWVVDDAIDRTRDRGMVLEVTPGVGSRPGVALRVHRANAEGVVGLDDRIGPWRSEPFMLSTEARTQCLRMRLTTDPWARADVASIPLAGRELWSVRIEEAP
jgi:eukaryotic-like serine/threonine-protein kinase